MATTLLLIRHGESDANRLHRFGGQKEYALTELGIRQAVCTGESLKNTKIDVFLASDLSRAYETAVRCAEFHHKPVTAVKGFREIYAGAWEGLSFEEIPRLYPQDFVLWRDHIGMARPTGGESVRELGERVLRTVESVVRQYPDKTVCIGTHATPIRTLLCHWLGKPYEEMKEIPWVPNASVTKIVYESDMTFHSLAAGIAAHLGALETVLPKNI